MDTTINERFVRLIREFRLNTSSFAKTIGKSYNAVESIVKGKTKPSYDVLEATFNAFPQINSDWLIKGDGELLRREPSKTLTEGNDGYLMQYLHSLEQRVQEQSVTIREQNTTIRALLHDLGKYKVVFAIRNWTPIFFSSGVQFRVQPVNPRG